MKFMKIFIIILIIIVPTRFLIHTLMSNNVEPFNLLHSKNNVELNRWMNDECNYPVLGFTNNYDRYDKLFNDGQKAGVCPKNADNKILSFMKNNPIRKEYTNKCKEYDGNQLWSNTNISNTERERRIQKLRTIGYKYWKEHFDFLERLISDNSSPESSSNKNVPNNFIDICKGKPTKFYESSCGSSPINIENKALNDNMDCEWECKNRGDCELYAVDENTCKMYNLNLDKENQVKKKVSVSCDNKVIPGNNYLGEGRVNNRLYTNNKNSFEYKDYSLDKANDIIDEYEVVDKNMKELKEMTYLQVDDIKRTRDDNEARYLTVQGLLRDLAKHLDLDKNKIYSNLVKDQEYSADETKNVIFNTGGVRHNVSYNKMLDMINTEDKTNANATSRLNNDKISLKSKQLVYLMLLIVMVISICILFIYKFSPDTISDFKLGVYFSIIILILLFVHYYFKI